MKISEMIEELNKIKHEHGDVKIDHRDCSIGDCVPMILVEKDNYWQGCYDDSTTYKVVIA